MKRIAWLAFLSLLVAFGIAQRVGAPDYQLKEGDILRIRYALRVGAVGATPDTLELRVEVPPGGMLTLPYAGAVQAAGRTVSEVEAELTAKLRRRFKLAEGFVVLEAIRKETFSIIGEVTRGGQYELVPGTTLRQALSLGGETTRRPELLRAVVFRNGKPSIEFDLFDVQATDNPAGDLKIEAGDVISIQTKRQIRVWASGLTRAPGEVTVEEGTTLRQLVATVGLPQVSASDLYAEERVQVSILRNGQQVFLRNLRDVRAGDYRDLPLQDGDYISIAAEPTQRVWVFGAVARPGQYDLPPSSTALQAIAAASGATSTATLSIVEVLRGDEVVALDLSATSPKPEDKRFALREGDIVYVRPNTRRIAVLGEVNRPGLHVIEDNMDPHVSDAIALAGGLTKRGPATRVSILRVQPNGEVERIPVDFSQYLNRGKEEFNPPIQPGDVVMVGETNRIEVQAIVNLALGLLGIRNLLR